MLTALAFALLLQEPAPLEKGLNALKAAQAKDGHIPCYGDDVPPGFEAHAVATTSIAIYTWLRCGTAVDDAAVARALDWLVAHHALGPDPVKSDKPVYDVSLAAMALSEAVRAKEKPPEAWTKALQRCAAWLVDAERSEGGWNYTKGDPGHDHYSMHLALLGLRAADLAGAKIPKALWEKERAHLKRSQRASGAWKYICGTPIVATKKDDPNPVLTAAGIAGLAMLDAVDGKSSEAEIRKGLDALPALIEKRDRWQTDPILLFSLDVAFGAVRKEFAGYAEAKAALEKLQQPDGSFSPARQGWIGHAMSLLFLKRAGPPRPKD